MLERGPESSMAASQAKTTAISVYSAISTNKARRAARRHRAHRKSVAGEDGKDHVVDKHIDERRGDKHGHVSTALPD